MSFGKRLRELREEKETTQKTLAEVIHVSPRMLSFYESGEHFPRDESTLLQLADYFGVSTDYLLGYSNVRQTKDWAELERKMKKLPKEAQNTLCDFADFLEKKYNG